MNSTRAHPPHSELALLLKAWREVTEAEGEAIASGRWDDVAWQQDAKRAIQDKLSRCEEGAVRGEPLPDWLRAMVQDLVAMEQGNAVRLQEVRTANQRELERIDGITTRLRSVRRAYGGAPSAHWVSFS